MFHDSPCVIQFDEASNSRALPLVLIHDGGGTCCSYFQLGKLNRRVYGISNPRFQSMKPWRGGMAEMISVYTELLANIQAPHGIILGGWSFGGLAALDLAARLAEQSGMSVKGIVMIDTTCPLWLKRSPTASHIDVPIPKDCQPEIRLAVQKSFTHCRAMSARWTPPVFGATKFGKTLPPTVLIRATEARQGQHAEDSHHQGADDLGWHKYDENLVSWVINVPGNHFSMFDQGHVGTTSAAVYEACNMIQKSTSGMYSDSGRQN